MQNYLHDNRVILKINKKITDKDVLEMLQLYFETKSLSSGDEILFFNYDYENDKIEITYRSNQVKTDIIRKKQFLFNNYELEVIDFKQPIHQFFHKLEDTLILNVANKNIDDVKLYASYLANDNTIKNFTSSHTRPHLYYIQFENPLNQQFVVKRHAKALKLKSNPVEVFEAFETFMVMVKLNLNGKSNDELSLYLDEIFQKNGEMYWQSCGDFSKIPFIIVKFINYSLKIKFLNEFVNNEIMIAIENVLNINLLNETVSSSDSKHEIRQIEDANNGEILIINNETGPVGGIEKTVRHIIKLTSLNKRPYQCRKCDYTTKYRSCYYNHSQQHNLVNNNNLVFKCKFCSYSTKAQCYTSRHENSIHKIKLEKTTLDE